MELVSMLAGEPFSDHPATACPAIAAFLRAYNDELTDHERQELLPAAAWVLGTASGRATRRRRREQLLRWTYPGRLHALNVISAWLYPSSVVGAAAAQRAGRLHVSRRRSEIERLLEELIGGPVTSAAAPSPAPEVAGERHGAELLAR
jgi:hypothetical protein